MTRTVKHARGVAAGALCAAAAATLLGCVEAVIVGGAATTAYVAADRRAAEVVAGDERISLTASSEIGNRLSDRAHVNVTSYNSNVLLTGEVPDAKTKAEAERIALGVKQVKGVVNELQVAGASSLASRGNDTYLTGKVKAAMVSENKVAANVVKVVTEAGVVYLLGIVTRREADDATKIARSVGGVQKVVRGFEYLAKPPR